MGLSYGVIMVIFLGALVPAVANRNFQYQSKERQVTMMGVGGAGVLAEEVWCSVLIASCEHVLWTHLES